MIKHQFQNDDDRKSGNFEGAADRQRAINLMKERRIEKLLITEEQGRLNGLLTPKIQSKPY